MAKIADFGQSAPYDADYVEIMTLVNREFTILDAEAFENPKGKGVHVLIQMDGREYRLCTHAVAVVDILSRQEVQECLKNGDYFHVRLVQVPSKVDKNRKVLKLEDAD